MRRSILIRLHHRLAGVPNELAVIQGVDIRGLAVGECLHQFLVRLAHGQIVADVPDGGAHEGAACMSARRPFTLLAFLTLDMLKKNTS
jgi:hypothetical protein